MWDQLWQWLSVTENQFIVLIVFASFFAGAAAARLTRSDEKTRSRSSTASDHAFIKGVQYILSNNHDRAIEEFTKSVQINSDTIETYVALANLYRSRGDIDRALRIRQSIVLRPNLDNRIRLQALMDMGLDYRKGGFLNRALEIFSDVVKKEPANLLALEELEKIHEEMKDWANAFSIRQKISGLVKGDHRHILAHHQTELGKVYQEQGDFSRAKSCFTKALSIDEACVDAYLHLGDLYFAKQDYKKAVATWKKVVHVEPRFTFLAYRRLEGAYTAMENLQPVEDFLKESARLKSDPFTHVALATYLYNKQDFQGALKEIESALALDPSFLKARKLMGEILLKKGMKEKALAAYSDLIKFLDVPYFKFQCNNCGFKPTDLQWQCPQCKKWDSIDFVPAGDAAGRPAVDNRNIPSGIAQEAKKEEQ